MAVLTALFMAAAWIEGRTAAFRPVIGTAERTILAFLAFATISMLWAFKPAGALVPLVTACGFFFSAVFLSNAVFTEDDLTTRRILEGFCIGLLIGMAYLGLEIFTGQVVKLAIFKGLHIPKSWLRPYRDFTWRDGELIAISPADLTRNIAPITMLFWPALLAGQKLLRPNLMRIFAAILIAVTVLVVMKSEHETSKLALLWGALVFAIARWSTKNSNRLLLITWVLACVAVIPAVLTLHKLDIQNIDRLQYSLRHRVIIWHHTAEEALKSPVLGIGAGMMYNLYPDRQKSQKTGAMPPVVPHAHNVYLQVWFELGAVGAALLTMIGLAIIQRIRLLDEPIIAYAQASFASFMVIAAASYGMWQPWFIAMFAMCTVLFAAVIRLCALDAKPV